MNSKSIAAYIPTFTLKGVSHNNVLSKYGRGDYSDASIVEGTPRDNMRGNMYSYSDKENITHKIVTTNHEAYNIFINNDKSMKCNKCLWCRRDLEVGEMGIGIPIKLEIGDRGYTYHVDLPYHCSHSCALSTLRRRQSSRIHRDTIYTDSESLLIHQHRTLMPGSPPLKESPDWILRSDNGGPLSDEEYYRETVTYKRSTNIIYLPVKVEYFINET